MYLSVNIAAEIVEAARSIGRQQSESPSQQTEEEERAYSSVRELDVDSPPDPPGSHDG